MKKIDNLIKLCYFTIGLQIVGVIACIINYYIFDSGSLKDMLNIGFWIPGIIGIVYLRINLKKKKELE